MTVQAITAYDEFAAVYDRFFAQDFLPKAMNAVERLLLPSLSAGASILDVACGPGRLAKELHARGFDVTGVDASAAMIEQARSNAPGCKFEVQDVRNLQIDRQFDAVISTYNAFAHLQTSEDLKTAMLAIVSHLRPGGRLLFDLNLEESYLARWKGSFAHVTEDVVCITEPTYDPGLRRASNRFTLFHREDDGQYRRSEVVLEQTCHSLETVLSGLQAAGCTSIQWVDAERDLGMVGESGRAFFLAESPEKP